MKKLSLKNLNLGANDLLQRNQLKTVFGGYDSVCAGNASPGHTNWSCNDGTSGSAYVCAEHLHAYFQMLDEFCS